MDEKYLLGFSLLPNIGSAKLRKIANYFPSFEVAWKSSSLEDFINAGLQTKNARDIVNFRPSIDIEKEYVQLQKEEIALITERQSAFPSQLKEIPSAPFLIFCRGNNKLLSSKQISVVGTRKPTAYGKLVVEKIIPQLGQAGLAITSGLAQGIDTIAHLTALQHQIPTIAVIGSGIDNQELSSSFNYRLAQQIVDKGGALITEFPPHYHASKITFPARNRIISGLSMGVLVVEAGDKSGSLITAQYALDQNRDIFSVPGNIFSEQSIGTHALLKQGAKVVTSANDILEALNFSPVAASQTERKVTFRDVTEKRIYQLLSYEPVHVDTIVKSSGYEPATVNMKLSLMELSGHVKSIGGGRFIRM